MSSLAEFIAAIMLWTSSMALCQFGLVVEHRVQPPPKMERVVARSPRQQAVQTVKPCPLRHAGAAEA